MSLGNLEILAVICTSLNVAWAIINFAVTRKLRIEYERFQKTVTLVQGELREQATQIQAAQFHVCSKCGKIVQGICLNCLVPTNESV